MNLVLAEGLQLTFLIIFSPALGELLLMTAKPNNGIYQAEPGETGYYDATFTLTPIPFTSYPFAMAFDYQFGFLYWTDRLSLEVSRSKLDGSEHSVLINEDTIAPRGIAVDTVNNRVLWCDRGKQEIEFVDFDGTSRGVLLGTGLEIPNDVVVSNKNGVVIWCDTGMKTIERSYLNGTGRVVIVSGIANMISLALDYKEKRVYWGDRALQRIESVYLDGSDRRIHVTHIKDLTSFDPYGIALRGEQDAIHFTDFSTGLLYRLKPSATEPMATQVKASTSSPLPDAPRMILFISDSATTTSIITTSSAVDHLTTASPATLTENSITTTQSTTTAESITEFSSSSTKSTSSPPSSSSSSSSTSLMNSITTTQSITTDGPITDPLIKIKNSKRFALGVNVCVRNHVISTALVKTSIQCAMMCAGINDCISFNFHPDGGLCELNDEIQEDVLEDMPTSNLPDSSCRYFEMK